MSYPRQVPAASPSERKNNIAAVAGLYKNRKGRSEEVGKISQQMEWPAPRLPLAINEATAFYAFALIGADQDDDPHHAKRRQAAALLDRCSTPNPTIRASPLLIHAYDKADLPNPTAGCRALRTNCAAALTLCTCRRTSLPSVGLWQEDIDSNLASVAASRNPSIQNMGDEGHQYHASGVPDVCLPSEWVAKAEAQETRRKKFVSAQDEEHVWRSMRTQVFALLSYSASYVLSCTNGRKPLIFF